MKKITAIVLSLAMVMSMLPAAFAADTAETITLDFTQANVDMSPVNPETGKEAVSLRMSDWKVNDGTFKFKSAFCIGTINEHKISDEISINRLYFRGGFGVNGCSADASENVVSTGGGANSYTWPSREKSLTITTNIENAGYYRVNLSGYKHADSSLFSVYVNREYAGDYNFYDVNINTLTLKKESLNVIYLPEGEVEITFKLRKNYGNIQGKFSLSALELVPQGTDYVHELSEVEVPELKDGALTLALGDKKEMSAKAKMKDGSYRQFGYTIEGKLPEADIISVESDSDAVSVSDVICVEKDNCEMNPDGPDLDATQDIDPTTTTFALTANTFGKANITVTALLGGKPTTKTFTVNVPAPAEINYVFNAGAYGSEVDIPAYSTSSGRQLVENTKDEITKTYKHSQILDDAVYVEPGGGAAPVTLETLDYTKTFAATGTNEWRMTAQYYIADDSKLSMCNSLILGTKGLNWRCYNGRTYPTALIILKVPEGTEGEYTPRVTYNATTNGYAASFLLIPESDMMRTTVDVVSNIESNEFAAVRWHRGYDGQEGNDDDYSYKETTTNRAVRRAIDPSDSTYAFTAEEKEQYLLGKVDMTEAAADEETENAELSPVTLSEGTYYLFVTYEGTINTGTRNITLCSLSFTPESAQEIAEKEFAPAVDEAYTKAPDTAQVTRFAYYGGNSKTIGTTGNVTYGETVTINGAEQTITDGDKTYSFLYWTKGLEAGGLKNRQALSTDLSFEYKPHEGANYLIAVYEEEGTTREAFYNRNGQLLTDLKIAEGKLPALPSMAGLGTAVKWEQLGTGEELDAGADVSSLEGARIFMAKYNMPAEGSITINGKKYSYGDTVKCSDLVNVDAESFSYWIRTINGEKEIVSIDPNYSFSAYADCTIAAACRGTVNLESARKILLSTFPVGDDMTAVMAEFIGFGSAKEKGIMFGSRKIAMTTDKAQFTVTNDTAEAVTVTGYAIDGNAKYVSEGIEAAGAGAE